jgi:hypothetical protein
VGGFRYQDSSKGPSLLRFQRVSLICFEEFWRGLWISGISLSLPAVDAQPRVGAPRNPDALRFPNRSACLEDRLRYFLEDLGLGLSEKPESFCL